MSFKGFWVYTCMYVYKVCVVNIKFYVQLKILTLFTKLFINIIRNDYRIVHHIYEPYIT